MTATKTDTAPTTSQSGRFALAVAIIAAAPARASLAVVLMVARGVAESGTVLLLAPLLLVAGVELGQGQLDRVAGFVASLLTRTGLGSSLATILALFVLVVVLRALVQAWQAVTMAALVSGFVLHLRQRLYHALLHVRWQSLARTRSSDILHLLSEDMSRVAAATATLIGLAASILIGLAHLVLAGFLSWPTTLFAVACGSLLLLVHRRETEAVRALGELLPQITRKMHALAADHVGGIRVLKSAGAEARSFAQFREVTEEVAQTNVKGAKVVHRVRAGFEIGSAVLLAILVYAALVVFQVSAAELLILLYLFSRLVPRFSGIQQSLLAVAHAMPSFRTVMTTIRNFDHEVETGAEEVDEPISLEQGISLARVSFSYDARGDIPAVVDLDLEIAAGEFVAIVGPSGAGKSTLADLLMGLLTPDRGEIRIDGSVLSSSRLRSWRRQVAYVPQEPFLFNDTIRQNLLWARPSAREADCWAALRLAAADDFVRNLPDGLDTQVGDRGLQLSGGERQRIVLARALLAQPKLLILDEATSALDAHNEARIYQAVEGLRGKLTIVMITHRLSTLRMAGRVYVLDGGRIVDRGTGDQPIGGASFRPLRALPNAQPVDADPTGPADSPASAAALI